ncbi:MAG: DUF3006 domain-containing protein [Acidaminococcales bacterium]|jgi:hypothetical protein|nr:DUF3006 domain-containing protein [Acidaminococcales bacterium]
MAVLLVVDRIEEGIAVLLPQGGCTGELKCPVSLLSPVKEGDVLRASFAPDPAATQKYRDEARKLLRKLLGE